jgi:flagella basal body P-ring formation protein FlgA
MTRLGLTILAMTLTGMLTAHARGDTANSAPALVHAASLRADLLQLSATLLAASRLHLDEEHSRVTTSRVVDADEQFVAVPTWQGGSPQPSMPLTFDLTPTNGRGGVVVSMRMRASVSAPLQREVLVMQRRSERGSPLACTDLALERRPARFVPPHAMQPPCALPADATLRRSLIAGETVRQGDAGVPPDVAALESVSVRVVIGQVALEKTGIALADARLGDKVRVRVNGSAQQLSARVVAHKVVVLEGSE